MINESVTHATSRFVQMQLPVLCNISVNTWIISYYSQIYLLTLAKFEVKGQHKFDDTMNFQFQWHEGAVRSSLKRSLFLSGEDIRDLNAVHLRTVKLKNCCLIHS